MELFSGRRWTTRSAQKTKQLCNVFKYSKLSKIFTLLERNNCRSADPVSHLLQLVKASLHQTSKDQYKLLASYFKAIFWHIFVERNGTPRTLFKQYLIQTIFCWSNLTKQVRFYFAKNIDKNDVSILFLESQKWPCCGYLGLKIKPTTHSS